jgi:hypothetical protein
MNATAAAKFAMPREKMAMRIGTLSKFTHAVSHMAAFHPSPCGLSGRPLAQSAGKSSFIGKI